MEQVVEVGVISQDSYYNDLSHLSLEDRRKTNFDHPSSIDFALLEQHLIALKNGESIEQPVYSFLECNRTAKTVLTHPTRRLKRDVNERGWDLDETIEKYQAVIKPMHEQFIEPTKEYADIIIPNNKYNTVAVEIVKSIINEKIMQE